MAQTLNIPNFSNNNIINGSNTQLTSQIASGVSSLPVQDVDDFSNSGYALIGNKGSGTSELLQVGTITTATAIPLTSATVQQHQQYDPVFPLFGNQLRIYRAADAGLGAQPPDSSFSSIATINIDYSEPTTVYTDSTGGGGYWYKFTYYNQTTTAETDIGSATAARGNFTVNYCSLDEIRRRAGFQYAPYITDNMIDDARQYAQDEINGALDEFYSTPLQPPINDYLRDICVRLAVARLLQDQYGQTTAGTTADGDKKMEEAQDDLQKLILKERVLTTKQGQALDEPGATGGIEGWPDSTSATADPMQGGAPRVFRMSDIQGQPYTVDQSGNPVGNLYYGRRW